MLQTLLAAHTDYRPEHGWWIDGAIATLFAVEPPFEATLLGFAYVAPPSGRGSQWFEPFRADVRLTAERDDLERYTIWFGDSRLSGDARLRYERRTMVTAERPTARTPEVAERSPFEFVSGSYGAPHWMFQFWSPNLGGGPAG